MKWYYIATQYFRKHQCLKQKNRSSLTWMPGVSSGDARFPLISACFVAQGAVRPVSLPQHCWAGAVMVAPTTAWYHGGSEPGSGCSRTEGSSCYLIISRGTSGLPARSRFYWLRLDAAAQGSPCQVAVSPPHSPLTAAAAMAALTGGRLPSRQAHGARRRAGAEPRRGAACREGRERKGREGNMKKQREGGREGD